MNVLFYVYFHFATKSQVLGNVILLEYHSSSNTKAQLLLDLLGLHSLHFVGIPTEIWGDNND